MKKENYIVVKDRYDKDIYGVVITTKRPSSIQKMIDEVYEIDCYTIDDLEDAFKKNKVTFIPTDLFVEF